MSHDHEMKFRPESIIAQIQAQSLLTEVLISGICSQLDLSRTQLISNLEVAHSELAHGLGESHELTIAFERHVSSLKSLLLMSQLSAVHILERENTRNPKDSGDPPP